MTSTTVGTIETLWRYPVKSMRGEALDEAQVTLQGLACDRTYAFVDRGSRSSFPWLTGRQLPSMLGWQPVVGEGKPPVVSITAPSGAVRPVDSEELLAELSAGAKRELFLLSDYRGSFDVAPITLISTATVNEIGRRSGTPPEPARFRMNVYVETGGEPFAEDAWVGKTLRLGDTVRVAVNERDGRCVMTTLDPAGAGESAPAVLRAIAEANQANAGVYGVVLTAGVVRPGDRITVED